MSEWISVSDRLPEPKGSTEYLVVIRHKRPEWKGRLIDIATYDARDPFAEGWGWNWNMRLTGDTYITHWMPLPEPPKEG